VLHHVNGYLLRFSFWLWLVRLGCCGWHSGVELISAGGLGRAASNRDMVCRVRLADGRIEILEAFYIQPAAAFLCSLIVVAAFVALLMAIFGVYPCVLRRFFDEIKVRYIILALIVIIAAGWAVTLSRALAERS